MSHTANSVITPQLLENALTYNQYLNLIENLLAEGKTTGPKQSDALTHYTKINMHRMKRIDKTIDLSEQFEVTFGELENDWIWLVITEAWCGDAAQNLPVIHKIADAAAQIDLKIILRDEHPDVMDVFTTNGSRSIPKMVCLQKDTLEVVGTWGPRPIPAQKLVQELKNKMSGKEYAKRLHKWYALDKTRHLQQEFLELISEWSEMEERTVKD